METEPEDVEPEAKGMEIRGEARIALYIGLAELAIEASESRRANKSKERSEQRAMICIIRMSFNNSCYK